MADGYVAGRNGSGGFHKSQGSGMVSGKIKNIAGYGRGLLYKTDFGERIPVKDIVYFNGSDPV